MPVWAVKDNENVSREAWVGGGEAIEVRGEQDRKVEKTGQLSEISDTTAPQSAQRNSSFMFWEFTCSVL